MSSHLKKIINFMKIIFGMKRKTLSENLMKIYN